MELYVVTTKPNHKKKIHRRERKKISFFWSRVRWSQKSQKHASDTRTYLFKRALIEHFCHVFGPKL